MKYFLFLLPFTLFSFNLFSQEPLTKTPAIIKKLIDEKRPIPLIYGTLYHQIPNSKLDIRLEKESQYYVRTTTGLYLGINGTGMLFKVKDSSGYISFTRIDSTFFQGISFFATNFSIKDTLFSLGGYGFWNSNGGLRYYNRYTNEWDILRTNREMVGQNILIWIPPQREQIYVLHKEIVRDGLSEPKFSRQTNDSLFKIDIRTAEWITLGKLTTTPEPGLNAPWGFLTFKTAYDVLLLDFKNNKIYKPSHEASKKIMKIFGQFVPEVSYFADSTLYFGSISANRIDSFHLSLSDFKDTGNPVYESESSQVLVFFILLFIALIFSLYFILNKRKKYNTPKFEDFPTQSPAIEVPEAQNQLKQIHPAHSAFNNIEIELLSFVLKKSKEQYAVTTDEINKILGLSNKNESVQKKNRSEVISLINKKWAVIYGASPVLLERQRTTYDRRIFGYFISKKWQNSLEELILSL